MDASLKNKNVKQKILEASRVIKKKYLSLKLDKAENDEVINHIINPIVKPLKDIQHHVKKEYIKKEKEDIKKDMDEDLPIPIKNKDIYTNYEKQKSNHIDDDDEVIRNSFLKRSNIRRKTFPYIYSQENEGDDELKSSSLLLLPKKEPADEHSEYFQTPMLRRQTLPSNVSFVKENVIGELDTSKKENEDDNDVFEEDDSSEEISDGIYYDQYPEYVRSLIKEFRENGKSDKIDKSKMGVRLDKVLDKWYQGSSILQFKDDGKLVFDNKHTFNATPGLLELMFYKNPQTFTKDDIQKYGEILEITNTLRRDYNPNGPMNNTPSNKNRFIKSAILPYKSQLSTLLPRRQLYKKGGAVNQIKRIASPYEHYKHLNNRKIDYIYWDDINELIDRLRLLVSSTSVGHTSHHNEIISILEELEEAGVIEFL